MGRERPDTYTRGADDCDTVLDGGTGFLKVGYAAQVSRAGGGRAHNSD